MPERPDESFCASLPTQPLVWDATRLAIASSCWRKHYYSTVLGLRGNGDESIHIDFGKRYHAAVEWFDLLLLHGAERETAILEVFTGLVKETWLPGEWDAGNVHMDKPWGGEIVDLWSCMSPAKVPGKRNGSIVPNKERCEHAKGGSAFMPLVFHDKRGDFEGGVSATCASCGRPAVCKPTYLPYHPKKNRVSLLRAFLVYADAPEAVRLYTFPDGTPAVEKQVVVDLALPSPDSAAPYDLTKPYQLCVNLDSIIEWEGEPSIRERKTTSLSILYDSYWDQFTLNTQIDTYALFDDGENPYHQIIVEAMEVGRGFARLRRMPIRITPERSAEWLSELQGLVLESEDRAYQFAQYGVLEEAFPRYLTSCHGPYGNCSFLSICSAAPGKRDALIAESYHVDRWSPLTGRSSERTMEP